MFGDAEQRAREEALEDELRAIGQRVSDSEEVLRDRAQRFQRAQDNAYSLAMQKQAATPELRQQFVRHRDSFHEVKHEAEQLMDLAREEHEAIRRELAVLRGQG